MLFTEKMLTLGLILLLADGLARGDVEPKKNSTTTRESAVKSRRLEYPNNLTKAGYENPKAKIEAQLRPVDARFLRRILREAYKTRGRHDLAWDSQMNAFLEKVEYFMGLGNDDQDRDELRTRAMSLQKTACNDGLFSYGYGFSFDLIASYPPSQTQLTYALERLPKQGYSNYLTALSAWGLSEHYKRQHETTKSQDLRDQSRRYFIRWINEESELWNPDGLPRVIHLLDTIIVPQEDTVSEWEKTDGFVNELVKSDKTMPWLKYYIQGLVALEKAWSARGGGWASDVREDQWSRYSKLLASARPLLIKAAELAPDQPAPANAMIYACWGGLNNPHKSFTPSYWFQKAVMAQFDYLPAYTTYTWALMPRWGGSHERMLAFAKECLQTARYDTKVPYQAVDVIRTIGQRDLNYDYSGAFSGEKKPSTQTKPNILGSGPTSREALDYFPVVQSALTGYVNHSTNASERASYLSELMIWCSLFGRPQEARQVWNLLEKSLIGAFSNCSGLKPLEDKQIDALLARGGKAGKVIDQALAYERNKQYPQAATAYKRVLEKYRDDPEACRFATDRIQQSGLEKNWMSGNWVALSFDKDLTGWTSIFGQWTPIDNHTVEAVSDNKGMRLMFNMNVGRKFEIKATTEYVKKVKPLWFTSGIHFAQRHENPEISRMILFRRDSSDLYISNESNILYKVADAKIPDKLSFRVRVIDEMVWVWVDDKLVYTGVWLEDQNDHQKGQELCLGGNYAFMPGAVIRFSNVQVKRIAD